MTELITGTLISDIARLMRKSFDARARAYGVTKPQWQVLMNLARVEGITQAGLCDMLEVESITLSRMVDRLVQAGLVERRADPGDRRAWRLYLAESARPLLDKLCELASEVINESLSVLTPEEQKQFHGMLERVRAHISTREDVEPMQA